MAKKRGRPRRQIRLPLAEVITRTIDHKVGPDGSLNYEAAVAYAWNLLRPAEQRDLGMQNLWQRLKDAMKRGRASARRAGTKTFEDIFPGLFSAYSLDPDGAKAIKQTAWLSMLEFNRALAVREAQLENDRASIEAMRRAKAALDPIWHEFPDLLFGEVCEIYRRRREAAE